MSMYVRGMVILQIQRLHVLCLKISLVHLHNSMHANVAPLSAKYKFSDVLCTRHVKTFNECISFEFCTDNKYSTFAILDTEAQFLFSRIQLCPNL